MINRNSLLQNLGKRMWLFNSYFKSLGKSISGIILRRIIVSINCTKATVTITITTVHVPPSLLSLLLMLQACNYHYHQYHQCTRFTSGILIQQIWIPQVIQNSECKYTLKLPYHLKKKNQRNKKWNTFIVSFGCLWGSSGSLGLFMKKPQLHLSQQQILYL